MPEPEDTTEPEAGDDEATNDDDDNGQRTNEFILNEKYEI